MSGQTKVVVKIFRGGGRGGGDDSSSVRLKTTPKTLAKGQKGVRKWINLGRRLEGLCLFLMESAQKRSLCKKNEYF